MIDEILPDGWIETKCSEFCSGRNRTFNPSTAKEKSYILYSVPSHATGEPETVTPKEIGSSKQHVSPGDTLISKINPRLNRTWVVGEHANRTIIASTEWIVFAASESFIPKFLAMFLQQAKIRDFLSHNASGVGGSLTRIKPAIFDQVPLPLPPLAEQKRIVAKIEELFSELDAGEESLRRARRQLGVYRQSLLKQAFEGKLTACRELKLIPLRNLIFDLSQGWSPKCELNRPPAPDEWAVIKTTAIQHCRYDDSEAKPLPPPFEPRPNIEIKDGDFLMTRKGPRTRAGVSCYVRKTRPKLMVCDTVYRFRCNESDVDPFYLELALNSPDVLHAIDQLKAGISESGLSLTHSKIGTVVIPLCSLPEQQEIVRLLDAQFEVIAQNEREIDAALKRSAALRQSILKKAFTGHLVPQDPTDEPASALLEKIKWMRNDEFTKNPKKIFFRKQ
jgi:type I restriction enzyme S subunit